MTELKDENKVRRRTEKELTNAKEELFIALEKEKELNKLKSRFISMISHEYRTPLTVIMTSTYVIDQLYDGARSEEFNSYLEKIRFSVKTMTDLLENVLTIGKEESEVKFNPSDVDIAELCNNVLNEIKVFDNKNHTFTCNHDTAENLVIETDERHLRQIISNLMTNAVKYSPEGTTIETIISADPKHAILIIRDQGIGIPEDDIPHIFEPFHRGENIGTSSGTGLGLAIVRRCVDILDGEIELDTKSGEGSEFRVRLKRT
jgi:signal transduction histidine kinase